MNLMFIQYFKLKILNVLKTSKLKFDNLIFN